MFQQHKNIKIRPQPTGNHKDSQNSTRWGQWMLREDVWCCRMAIPQKPCLWRKNTYQLIAFLIKAKTVALTLITIMNFTLTTRNKWFFHKRWLAEFWTGTGCETYELLLVSGTVLPFLSMSVWPNKVQSSSSNLLKQDLIFYLCQSKEIN